MKAERRTITAKERERTRKPMPLRSLCSFAAVFRPSRSLSPIAYALSLIAFPTPSFPKRPQP